jgi:hypothetical protein
MAEGEVCMFDRIWNRFEFLGELRKHHIARWVLAIYAIVSLYDTAGSEFLPPAWAQKRPTVYQIVAMTTGWISFDGWLFIGAVLIFIFALERSVRPPNDFVASQTVLSRLLRAPNSDASAGLIIAGFVGIIFLARGGLWLFEKKEPDVAALTPRIAYQPPQISTPSITLNTPLSDAKKRLEEIGELEKSTSIVRRIYADGNSVLEALNSRLNMSQQLNSLMGIRDRSIATSGYQSQTFSKYHFDDVASAIKQAPMIAGACNHLMSLINNGTISPDLQQEPAYLDFSSAMDELKSWLDDTEPQLKSLRDSYEKAIANAN